MYEYDKVVLEVDADGTEKARNLYGTNLLMRTIDDESYYYLYNGHADVTALINTDRSIATTYYYDAFGNILEQTGDVDNNITYSGYQYDEETGLYYLNARMYDPKIARFLQEDTYRGNINDPLSLNLYTYCNNNPMVYIDPSGHKPFRDAWNWIKDKWWKITGKDNNNDDSEPVLKEYEPSNTELFINKLDEAAGRTKVFLHGFGSGLGGDALGELACEIFYGSPMTDEEKQQYHLRTLQDSMDKSIYWVPDDSTEKVYSKGETAGGAIQTAMLAKLFSVLGIGSKLGSWAQRILPRALAGGIRGVTQAYGEGKDI